MMKTLLLVSACLVASSSAWVPSNSLAATKSKTALSQAATTATWFADVESKTDDEETSSKELSVEQLKAQVLQLGAALDRGQSYNPTSGEYYSGTMEVAKSKILELLEVAPSKVPSSLEDLEGEWELVLTTVPHGIFRSSPFFLAVQEAFGYAEEKGKCSSMYLKEGSTYGSTY